MIIGLRIHTDTGKVQLADAPDNYICGDLLFDILGAAHPGAAQGDWGLQTGVPERLLSLSQTLEQNHVGSNDDLYLVPIKRVMAQHLALEFAASQGSTLDAGTTLTANDVATRDRLPVEQSQVPPLTSSMLVLHVNAPSGRTRSLEASSDTSTSKLLRDLVTFFGLATQTRAETPIHWILVNEDTNAELDPGSSLAENGIETGGHLLLRPVEEQTYGHLIVTVPDGRKRDVAMSPDQPAQEFIQDVVSLFGLSARDQNKIPGTWLLFIAGSKRKLDPNKTLAENRVTIGVELSVRHVETAWANSRMWLVITPIVLAVVAGAVWLVWPAKPLMVQIKSSKPSVSALGTVAFAATVEHAKNPSVRWSIDPQVGSIAADGLYSAPSFISQNQVVHVTAISRQDATKSSTIELTLLTVPISLSPADTQLGPSEAAQFSAALRPDAGTSVHWSVNPQVGVITMTGEYRAPSYISAPQTVIVTATSEQFPQFAASARISLSSSPPLHVLPSATVLQASQSRQFTLRPDPGALVHWQIHPTVGNVSTNGVYSAPALIAQEQQVVISASGNGVGNSSKAVISLKPVSVGAIISSASNNRQIAFHANLVNSMNTNILWSIEPQLGSISAQGVYTPPAELESAKTATVKATSQADPSKFATYVVHLVPVVSLRFNSYNPVLVGKQRENFSVNVKGTSNKAVTWSSVGPGVIMPNGLYIPPSTIPAEGAAVSIIATSNADPSRSVKAAITLHPAATYAGARTGTITWQGKLDKNQVLTIRNNVPDAGSIIGGLPSVPVQIHLNTRKCDLLTVPSEANSWTLVVIRAASSQKMISLTWTITPGS